MIAEQNGNLVWFHPLPAGDCATNFQVQQYEGKPVLTWWQGRILEVGFGQGEDVIYNTSYQHVATICAGNGYHADLHEIRLTPQGTAWIDIFDPIHMNLSSVARRARRRADRLGRAGDRHQDRPGDVGVARARAHPARRIATTRRRTPATRGTTSTSTRSTPGDPSAGDVLLSSRNTWTLYDVDLHSGAIRWRLGGSHSSFKLGAGTRFYWQHDAEWQPGGLISVFDNGSDPPKEKQSRGLLLDPNTSTPHGDARQAVHQPDEDAAGRKPGQHAQPVPAPPATG